MILDTQIDQGIRMPSEWITMADLKARFLADTRFADQEQYCKAYLSLFAKGSPLGSKKGLFVPSEYENLGNGGCI